MGHNSYAWQRGVGWHKARHGPLKATPMTTPITKEYLAAKHFNHLRGWERDNLSNYLLYSINKTYEPYQLGTLTLRPALSQRKESYRRIQRLNVIRAWRRHGVWLQAVTYSKEVVSFSFRLETTSLKIQSQYRCCSEHSQWSSPKSKDKTSNLWRVASGTHT